MVPFLLIVTVALISSNPIGDWDTFEKAVRDQQIKKMRQKPDSQSL
jgi:hypothetical protein